jgi:hypothetical protein
MDLFHYMFKGKAIAKHIVGKSFVELFNERHNAKLWFLFVIVMAPNSPTNFNL